MNEPCRVTAMHCVAVALPGKKVCALHHRDPGLRPQELTRAEKHQRNHDPFAPRQFPSMPWDKL